MKRVFSAAATASNAAQTPFRARRRLVQCSSCQAHEYFRWPVAPVQRHISTTGPRRQGGQEQKSRHGREKFDELSGVLDSSLDFKSDNPATPTTRNPKFQSPSAQRERQPEKADSSYTERSVPVSRSPLTDLFSKPRNTSRFTLDDLDMPTATSPASSVGKALDPQGNTNITIHKQTMPLPLPMRLGPAVGRTIKVNPERNIDVGRAFKQLDQLVKRNAVRADFNRQKFHERPGLRRKRLKSERWRKHFKEGFKGMVAMVKRMKKQGW